ncbi:MULTISPECIES: hypothetical protein [unclassified Paenibacillus]|uniref:hypothetical protein n=1 Tax=unclassified Paenibacillus TaxID=185978 RepID=UPI0015C4963E|nr:hypothetical protein [Paenibacillus sp. 11B]
MDTAFWLLTNQIQIHQILNLSHHGDWIFPKAVFHHAVDLAVLYCRKLLPIPAAFNSMKS